jgi:AcrR family transcriptional regulator
MPDTPYHHGDLREALLLAAARTVDSDGVEALSMRGLARDLGVSSAAPFRHYPDKRALLHAVAERAGQEVERRLAEAVSGDDALTQVRAMAVAYVRYAAEHPALFELIHARNTACNRFSGMFNDERRLNLTTLIIEGQNAGLIPEVEPELFVLTTEALTHGLAMMIARHHPRVAGLDSEEARRLALAVTQLLQRGIGVG